MPRLGFCVTTRPFLTFEDVAVVIFPAEQSARVSARLAAFTVLPTTFGTTHCRMPNLAFTLTFAAVLSVQKPRRLQGPDQPRNLEPLAGTALSVTVLPYA